MRPRVLVIGAMGMLGAEVLAQLSASRAADVTGSFNHAQPPSPSGYMRLNAAIPAASLRDLIKGFDVVINCAVKGISFFKDASADSLRELLEVNSVFPKRLALVAGELGIRILHISTDGVFSGRKGAPYGEDSIPDPQELYGASKFLGEVNSPVVLNIRTSIVGRDPTYHRGLLEWFLAQADGASVRGYTDHIWQGVTTGQLANVITKLIASTTFDYVRQEGPVHHFCPNRAMSKYELLGIFKEVFSRSVVVEPIISDNGGVDRRMRTKYTRLLACYGDGLRFEDTLV